MLRGGQLQLDCELLAFLGAWIIKTYKLHEWQALTARSKPEAAVSIRHVSSNGATQQRKTTFINEAGVYALVVLAPERVVR